MAIKDVQFYNAESSKYSKKRYPKVTLTYTQFFFKKRLEIILRKMSPLIQNKKNISILEIGCADGIVVRNLRSFFPDTFSKLVGIDTSPGMINVAKTNEANTGINFFIRSDFESLQKFDFIFEIGVINYADLDTEIKFGAENLKNDGYFVCTVAATSSLSNIFKRNPHEYNNFLSYGSYEKSFRKFFDIEKSFPVGLFIPFLWRMPLLAGFLQPFVEIILRPLVPNIFHEKIYILKKR